MSITIKDDLELMLVTAFQEPLNIDIAYETYINYIDLINTADNITIDYLWRLVKCDYDGILKTRMSFAEKGFELTPNECEQYIFILATSLVDCIGNKPNA